MLYIIFWKRYLLGLALNCTYKLLVFLWVLIVLLLLQIFLFFVLRDPSCCLSDINQANVIEAFNSTSSYLDDLLNIVNPYFEQMLSQIYPAELQLN